MKKFPWKGVAIGCGILTVLVIARCAVTVGWVFYFGGNYWRSKLMEDPWFFIGMAAAGMCAISLLVLADQKDKQEKEEKDKENKGGLT